MRAVAHVVSASERSNRAQNSLRGRFFMLENEARVNLFLTQYCGMLVGDIADERLAEQPLPGVNHPAWVLGHRAFSADQARWLLGAEKELPAEWAARVGPGSEPAATRGACP